MICQNFVRKFGSLRISSYLCSRRNAVIDFLCGLFRVASSIYKIRYCVFSISMSKKMINDPYVFPGSESLVVCGDIHGDISTLVNKICVQYQLRNIVVIVAGDCGFGFEKKGYYETVFNRNAKRMNEANNADPTGSFMARISSQVNETKVSIRGAGSSRVRLENASEMHESMIDNWVYLTLVFNGTTGAIYENGALCRSGTFNVATDNDAPLVFGNTAAIAGGATGEQAWNGWK